MKTKQLKEIISSLGQNPNKLLSGKTLDYGCGHGELYFDMQKNELDSYATDINYDRILCVSAETSERENVFLSDREMGMPSRYNNKFDLIVGINLMDDQEDNIAKMLGTSPEILYKSLLNDCHEKLINGGHLLLVDQKSYSDKLFSRYTPVNKNENGTIRLLRK